MLSASSTRSCTERRESGQGSSSAGLEPTKIDMRWIGNRGQIVLISRGRPTPFVEENGRLLPGSISQKSFVNINGVRQGMFIRGKNATNPVLLYLHGGVPEYFLTERYPIRFEDDSRWFGGNSVAPDFHTAVEFLATP